LINLGETEVQFATSVLMGQVVSLLEIETLVKDLHLLEELAAHVILRSPLLNADTELCAALKDLSATLREPRAFGQSLAAHPIADPALRQEAARVVADLVASNLAASKLHNVAVNVLGQFGSSQARRGADLGWWVRRPD
jgi:hypothetical protein